MTNTSSMTIGNWDDKNYRMSWSIYDQKSYAEFEAKPYTTRQQSRADYMQILLDLRAPEGTPDGIHKVQHRSGWTGMPTPGVSVGVIVRDGRFLPDPTEATVYEAVCKSYAIPEAAILARQDVINHVFIESFEWDPEWGGLLVHTGS